MKLLKMATPQRIPLYINVLLIVVALAARVAVFLAYARGYDLLAFQDFYVESSGAIVLVLIATGSAGVLIQDPRALRYWTVGTSVLGVVVWAWAFRYVNPV